jgi:transposase
MKKNVSIDISSKTLDICIKENGIISHKTIKNDVKIIYSFFKQINNPETVVSMENTGRYNWNLYEVLAKLDCTVYVISPLHIKKSLGLVRGKNDKIDARRIGSFVEKNIAELTPWKPCSESIKKLKILLTERNARLKMTRQLVCQRNDYSLMKSTGLDKDLILLNKNLIENIKAQIKEIEEKISKIFIEDNELKEQADFIKSVPGVGKVLCWTMIAKTEGFQTITEARKMACYSGVVPFDYQSGTSIKSRPKVSQYADKSIKSILHLAAMSAIQHNNDLAIYYKRKVNEGKNKMSVLNAVRNKIIHRIFAVIKNQKKYEFNLVTS